MKVGSMVLLGAAMVAAIAVGAQEKALLRAASDGEQQAIELATVKGLASRIAKDYSSALPNAALDTRLHGSIMDSDESWKTFHRNPDPRTKQDSSFATSSHSSGHMSELAAALGVPSIVNDQNSTCQLTPGPCRIGKHSALFVLSPARIRGDTAFVALKAAYTDLRVPIAGDSRSPVETFHAAVYQTTLVKVDNAWKVARVAVLAVN